MVLFRMLFGAIGLFLGLLGVAYVRAYVQMRTTESTNVREVNADAEIVEVTGTARAVDEPLTAPFTDEEAVACLWKMQRPQHDEGGWTTLESGEAFEPFVVDDGTGEILVDPDGAEWILEKEEAIHTDEETPPPPPIRRFLDEHGYEAIARSEEPREDRRRFLERRLDPGEDVYTYGPVMEGPADEAPNYTVTPYLGTDAADDRQNVDGRTSMVLEPDILPGVGDPDRTLSLGAAGEGTFTIADSTENVAQRRYLTRGAILLVFGAIFFVVPFLTLLN